MSKVTIAGSAIVLTSAITEETFAKAVKFDKSALQILNEKKEPEFQVSLCEDGPGAVGKNGILFNSVNAEGQLELTMIAPEITTSTVEEKLDFVKWNVAPFLVKLDLVEAKVAASQTAIDATLTAALSNVTVL